MKKTFLSVLFVCMVGILSACQFSFEKPIETETGSVVEQEEKNIYTQEKIKSDIKEIKKHLTKLEERIPWYKFISEKYNLSFLYPNELRANSSNDVLYKEPQSDNSGYDISIRYGKSEILGDVGAFSFSDEFKNKLLTSDNCDFLKTSINYSSPVNFKRPFLCGVIKNTEKEQTVLYAIGVDSVYGDKLNGMIFIVNNITSILLEGQGLLLEENNLFISKKIQEMFEKNEELTRDIFSKYPPSEKEINASILLARNSKNFEFLKEIAESIEIKK